MIFQPVELGFSACTFLAILFVVHESSYSAHIFWTQSAITIVLFTFGFLPVLAWRGSGLRHVEITGTRGDIGWSFPRLGWGCGKVN